MGILREIRRLPDAMHRLTAAIHALSDVQASNGPAADRLEALERSRSLWEAEMEAEYLRADSKYKAAAAAESRARKQLDKLDPFPEEGEPGPEALPDFHAEGGEGAWLPPVREDLEVPSQRELAKRMKFLS